MLPRARSCYAYIKARLFQSCEWILTRFDVDRDPSCGINFSGTDTRILNVAPATRAVATATEKRRLRFFTPRFQISTNPGEKRVSERQSAASLSRFFESEPFLSLWNIFLPIAGDTVQLFEKETPSEVDSPLVRFCSVLASPPRWIRAAGAP